MQLIQVCLQSQAFVLAMVNLRFLLPEIESTLKTALGDHLASCRMKMGSSFLGDEVVHLSHSSAKIKGPKHSFMA
jgi:hypothetical protein